MRKSKYVATQFCFYDRSGIQKMLEKQAQKGWMLAEIHNFTWEYHRIEPQELHFAVTYYPKASAFDPYPSAEEEMYREFASHSGWKFVASNAQLQIFCSEAENPVPIETDPLVELQNIHRAVKKSFLPSYCLLLFCALMNLGMNGWRLMDNFTGTLANNVNLFAILCWTLLAAMEIGEISSYFFWRWRALKAAKLDGSFVETRNRNNIMWMILALVIAAYILMVSSLSSKMIMVAVLSAVFMLGAVYLVLRFTKWMKKTGFSREDNRAYTILATVFVSVAVTVLFTWAIVSTLNRLPDDHVKDSYYFNGITVTRHGDDLPLTVEMLTGEDDGDYSLYKTVESSVLIDRFIANQYRNFGTGEGSSLRYVVVDVKFASLFDACLRDYLGLYHNQQLVDVFGNEFYGEFYPVDPTPWGADRAWQLVRLEEEAEYLLVYGNRIVNIDFFDFSQEPSQKQMDMVAQIFGNEQKFENNENK